MNDQHSTTVTGAALVAAPLLLLTATILMAVRGEGMNNGAAAGAVLVWAMIAFAVGLVGLTRRFAASLPRAAALLPILILVGCAGGVGFGVDAMHAALTSGGNLMDAGGIAMGLGLAVPGALFWLGVAATGVAADRAGMISRWATVAIVLGAVLFPVSRMPSIAALSIAADLLLVAGLASVGLGLLTRSARSETGAAAPAVT